MGNIGGRGNKKEYEERPNAKIQDGLMRTHAEIL